MSRLTSFIKKNRFSRRTTVLTTSLFIVAFISVGICLIRLAHADSTAQTLPFAQNWTNTGQITANDNWSGVPGIIGYRGDDLTTATGTDPRTIIADGTSTPVNVIANQTAPNTLATGGVAEFEIANPSIALNGSGTADAPFILINLNTSGKSNINVAYNLRDLDGSVDNAIQSVNMQYRVGSSGNFSNVSGGYVADATSGPSLATLVTPVSASLPSAADNQPLVQVRVMTTNAVGNDEWVGIDDISITGSTVVLPTNPTGTGAANPNSVLPGNSTLLTVTVNPGANPTSTGLAVTADLSSIGGIIGQTFYDDGSNGDATAGDNVFSYTATVSMSTTAGAKSLPFTITDAQLRSGSGSISLTIQSPPPPADHVVISQIYGGGGNSGATYRNDYIELYNPSSTTFSLNGWSIQYAAATGSGWGSQLVPLAGPIAPGEYYLIKLASGGAAGLDLPQANAESSTVNMSATAGKIALVNNAVGLTGASPDCPTEDPNLVDLVGWGSTANCHEGSANAPGGGNSTAIFRKGNGGQDTNQNDDDFQTGAPNPRRTAIILDSPPSVTSVDEDSDPGASTPAPIDGSVAVFFSEPVDVTGTWYDLTCANTGNHTTVVSAGPRNWVITPNLNFQPGEQCTFTVFASHVRDSDTDDSQPNTDFMQADYTTTFTVATGVENPEDPSVHLTMGNPSGAVADTNQPNNYLIQQNEYAISYNRDRGEPNWVSWHLSDEWTGTLTRVDTFRPDPDLPVEWYRVNQFDYSGSGFDRGHMTPSADRLSSLPVNQGTFRMDNIVPQSPDNNQGPWERLESYLRTLLPANEIYIVSGPAGVGGVGSNGAASTITNGHVTVPAETWKVALVLPKASGDDISRVDCSTRTIAVIMPNIQGIRDDSWEKYLKTVDQVEALTDYDFFSNLPEPIQRCVEAGTNGNNPPLDTDADGVPDETDNCPYAANANQADFDQDGIGDACDSDDDNDGQSDADEIACGSNPMDASSKAIDTDSDNQPDCVDTDDDNDNISDSGDNCSLIFNPDQADFDHDGIGDACDSDDDNDGVADTADSCPTGDMGWTSNAVTDHDGDGCRDATEDTDDDNDGKPDMSDSCPTGDTGWTSNAATDHDSDGCRDAGEDTDDDNDGVADTADSCPTGETGWTSNAATDHDDDGCRDATEDTDDDNDGVADNADNCPLTANPDQADADHDGRGDACDACPLDAANDADGDGVCGNLDNCPSTANPDQADADHDGRGDVCDSCPLDAANDIDHDGVCGNVDNCPTVYNPDQLDTNHDGTGDACTGFQFPVGGAFVIGDNVNLTGGATVYFWGSQWSQNNPLSGGSASNSFKGFEGGNTSPTCGGTWTSSPGNSSNPPAAVPQYMAVIVASSIQKNGSVLSGDIKKIVIVKTDSGYGPSPGQAGTGQVVAIICITPAQASMWRFTDQLAIPWLGPIELLALPVKSGAAS